MGALVSPPAMSRRSLRPQLNQIRGWVRSPYTTLGTDGFGRSDTREALRHHFEIDAANIVVATLHALAREGKIETATVTRAIREFDIDPEKQDPLLA